MSEPTYFILATLLDGPLHGYGIIKRAEELSGGTVRLAVGTLYGALDRLVGKGLIEVEGEEIVDGRGRRYFRITEDGWHAVTEEAKRMARSARIVMNHAVSQRGQGAQGRLGWQTGTAPA